MGKKVRICLEIQGLGMDENGKPCPAGICLTRVIWIYTAVPRWHSISTVALSYPLTWGLTAVAFVIYYFGFVRKRLMRANNGK